MTQIAGFSSKLSGKKFYTKQVSYVPGKPLYCLVQCTPDLSEYDCNRCLQTSIVNLTNDTAGAKMLSDSCYLRYEFFPFYVNIAIASPPDYVPKVADRRHPKVIKIIVAVMAGFVLLGLVAVISITVMKRKVKTKRLSELGKDFRFDPPELDSCSQQLTNV